MRKISVVFAAIIISGSMIAFMLIGAYWLLSIAFVATFEWSELLLRGGFAAACFFVAAQHTYPARWISRKLSA